MSASSGESRGGRQRRGGAGDLSHRPSPLDEYRRKRDGARTPEPVPPADGARQGSGNGGAGGAGRSTSGRRTSRASRTPRTHGTTAPVFVIQEHHASSLHWDFRLERDGVLVSWALPKGLPVDPGHNHLAVHTEDHPMEYATFQGEIPEGEYGGGSVTVWDRGHYEVTKWVDGEVSVVLEGGRSHGNYVLFRTRDDQWMIHRKDPPPPGWEPMPDPFRPMLAVPGALPEGADWAYEFKWDGIRAGVAIDGGRVAVRSRGGGDLTAAFPELRGLGEAMGSTSVLFDGELVAFDPGGRPDFGLVQRRVRVEDRRRAARLAGEVPVSFIIFDLLYLDGEVLTDQTYRQRRRRLEALAPQGDHWALTPSFTDVAGTTVMDVAREAGLEGVVSKRLDGRYVAGRRNGLWVKTKLVRAQEVVIGGYTAGNGSRRDTFGALLLGVPGDDGLAYVGRVGTGFSRGDRDDLMHRLRPLERKTSPFADAPAGGAGVVWTRPSVVGEVQFAEWTRDGVLRHPSWRGLRPDKSAGDVVRE